MDGGDLPPGPDDALADLRAWEEIGVTHVIDNRLEWSDKDLVTRALPEVAYLHNGVDDVGQRMPDQWFDRGVDFALDAWTNNSSAVIAVHCHMGINRGPSLAYAILLALGWDPIEAVDLIRTKRPIAAVGYAEDALDWNLRCKGADDEARLAEKARLVTWRRANPHDTYRIIRAIRVEEAA